MIWLIDISNTPNTHPLAKNYAMGCDGASQLNPSLSIDRKIYFGVTFIFPRPSPNQLRGNCSRA